MHVGAQKTGLNSRLFHHDESTFHTCSGWFELIQAGVKAVSQTSPPEGGGGVSARLQSDSDVVRSWSENRSVTSASIPKLRLTLRRDLLICRGVKTPREPNDRCESDARLLTEV